MVELQNYTGYIRVDKVDGKPSLTLELIPIDGHPLMVRDQRVSELAIGEEHTQSNDDNEDNAAVCRPQCDPGR